jgi:uncharacterized protein YjbI with pentapeptide repeats
METLDTSGNLMTVLSMVTQSSSELGGWAKRQSAPEVFTREPSQSAVNPFGRQIVKQGAPKKFNPDDESTWVDLPFRNTAFEIQPVAISSLQSICTVLQNDPAYTKLTDKNGNNIDLARDYIAPIVYPKCQSDDPAVAGSALIACSLILPNKEDRETEAVKRALSQGSFSNVNLSWEPLNLRFFDFSYAQFAGSTIDNADISSSKLAGASFFGAKFNKTKLESVVAANIPDKPKQTGALRDLTQQIYENISQVAKSADNAPPEGTKSNWTQSMEARQALAAKGRQRKIDMHFNGKTAQCSTADFRDVQFRDLTLGGGDKRSVFSACTFDAAEFQRSSFDSADCDFASYFRIVAPSIRFSDTNIDYAAFEKAELENAEFCMGSANHALFISSNLKKSKFSNSDPEQDGTYKEKETPSSLVASVFDGADLSDCQFDHCDLSDAIVWNTAMVGTQFTNVVALRTIIKGQVNEQTLFENSDLTMANLGHIDPAQFRQVVFKNTDLDWALVPWSAELEAVAKGRNLWSDDNSVKLEGSCAIIVRPTPQGLEYMGIIRTGAADKFEFGDKADNGSGLIDMLRDAMKSKETEMGIRLSEEFKNPLPQDYKSARKILNEKWGILFAAE